MLSQSVIKMNVKNIKYSFRIFATTAILFGVIAILVIWQRDYLYNLYFVNQVTSVGLVINSGIIVLFLAGAFQLVRLFLIYGKEEETLDSFYKELSGSPAESKLLELSQGSIIGSRFRTLIEFYSARTEINHNALAATLLAQEASRTSFPKFVNNTLILTGVFGTIVSLTVALLGASTAITETESMDGMNLVIHGMSTALSTTMTAILAYFMFAFFYLKLLDKQSYILGRVEHLTATILIPRYQVVTHDPEQSLSEMLSSAAETIKDFDSMLRSFTESSQGQSQIYSQVEALMNQNLHMLQDIRQILRDGFRLREHHKEE